MAKGLARTDRGVLVTTEWMTPAKFMGERPAIHRWEPEDHILVIYAI
jgi:hypothetical protein